MPQTSGLSLNLGDKKGLIPEAFVSALLNEAVVRVNAGVSTTLTARLGSEKPPSDSRHLTDTRTRVSTLLEYSLAYEMNHVLAEKGDGYSVSAVLWNVFPDLIVRDPARANLVGLEVKALHTAAEEKSANFMTPIQVVRKGQDFIVIISWGWQTATVNGAAIVYPHIHAADVFDAWLLAKIRDYGWLLKQGGRVKAIDLATPIINGSGKLFKAEEGNLGKLMRIQLPSEMPRSVPDYKCLVEEDIRYTAFKQRVLGLGLRETFVELCVLDGATVISADAPNNYPPDCKVLGSARRSSGNTIFLFAGSRPDQWLRTAGPLEVNTGDVGVWLSRKLDWRVFLRKKNSWQMVGSGAKPDSDYQAILSAIENV